MANPSEMSTHMKVIEASISYHWILILVLIAILVSALLLLHRKFLRNRENKIHNLTNQLASGHSHFKRLAAATSRLAKLQDPEKVLMLIVKAAVQDFGFRMAFIGIAKEDLSVEILRTEGYMNGFFPEVRLSLDDSKTGSDPTGNCMRTLEPKHINLLEADSESVPYRDQALARGFRSCASVPLVLSDIGHGALTVFSEHPDAFTEAEIKSLQIFSNYASVAYEAAILFAKLHNQSNSQEI